MFKALKYIYLTTLLQKAKKHFLMLVVYVISILIVNLIANDFIAINQGTMVYILIFMKWIFTLLLLGFLLFTLLKVINIASNPLKSTDTKDVDERKERIISRKTLLTQSNLIIQKYTEVKQWKQLQKGRVEW